MIKNLDRLEIISNIIKINKNIMYFSDFKTFDSNFIDLIKLLDLKDSDKIELFFKTENGNIMKHYINYKNLIIPETKTYDLDTTNFINIINTTCKMRSLPIIPIHISDSDDVVKYVHYIKSINTEIKRGQTIQNIRAGIEETECSICLDTFQNKIILNCGHSFCKNCIISNNILHCPLCRSSIKINCIIYPETIKIKRIIYNHLRKSTMVVDEYIVYIQKIPTIGKVINFIKEPRWCKHVKPQFSKLLFVCENNLCNNIIFHVVPDEYKKTAIKCVFFKNHSLYKCNSCGIKII
jgi:hypothetical protein